MDNLTTARSQTTENGSARLLFLRRFFRFRNWLDCHVASGVEPLSSSVAQETVARSGTAKGALETLLVQQSSSGSGLPKSHNPRIRQKLKTRSRRKDNCHSSELRFMNRSG